MKCPECGEYNDEGISICQHCDAILDASFLGDDYTDEHDGPDDLSEDNTSSGPAPAEPASPGRSHRRSFVVGSGSDDYEEEEQPEWEDEEFAEIERQRAAHRTKRAQQKERPHSATPAPSAQGEDLGSEASQVQKDVEGSLNKVKDFLKGLEKADKISIGGALGMFVFPLFPWVNITSQGSRAGLEVGGWFLMLLALCVGTLVYLRQDEHWKGREKYVLYVQAGVVVISLLFLLARMINLGSIRHVMPDGTPALPGLYSASAGIGLILSLLACLAAGAGTGRRLKEKVLKK